MYIYLRSHDFNEFIKIIKIFVEKKVWLADIYFKKKEKEMVFVPISNFSSSRASSIVSYV